MSVGLSTSIAILFLIITNKAINNNSPIFIIFAAAVSIKILLHFAILPLPPLFKVIKKRKDVYSLHLSFFGLLFWAKHKNIGDKNTIAVKIARQFIYATKQIPLRFPKNTLLFTETWIMDKRRKKLLEKQGFIIKPINISKCKRISSCTLALLLYGNLEEFRRIWNAQFYKIEWKT